MKNMDWDFFFENGPTKKITLKDQIENLLYRMDVLIQLCYFLEKSYVNELKYLSFHEILCCYWYIYHKFSPLLYEIFPDRWGYFVNQTKCQIF